jgi:hypothetical protein
MVLALLAGSSARPDTITTKDNLSIHGSLVEMSKGILKIKARFPSEEKEVWVPVKNIQTIEFNLLTYNPGAPPKILGFGAPNGQDTSQNVTPPGDTIVFRDGKRLACNLVDIDTDHLHCDQNGTNYNRNEVLRIVLGPR